MPFQREKLIYFFMLSSLKILTTSIFYSENHIKISVQAILHCHWSISILLLCYWSTFSSVQSIAGFRNNFQDHRRLPIFSESKMSLEGLWRHKFFHKQIFKNLKTITTYTESGDFIFKTKNIFILWHYPFKNWCFRRVFGCARLDARQQGELRGV